MLGRLDLYGYVLVVSCLYCIRRTCHTGLKTLNTRKQSRHQNTPPLKSLAAAPAPARPGLGVSRVGLYEAVKVVRREFPSARVPCAVWRVVKAPSDSKLFGRRTNLRNMHVIGRDRAATDTDAFGAATGP